MNTPQQVNRLLQDPDRSDWETLKFEDIAFHISERAEPNETTKDIYVGLEHLDSGSLHIRRHGKPSDVKGTKLNVYKGDIIFGKRRAYQRKAAIADFDGICSAHAMVLRANPKNVDPAFFPFFLHSDVFMNRAVQVSEGSLSPTIKWKVLKEQVFLMPPRSLQKKLAKLLWATDGCLQVSLRVVNSALKLRDAIFSENIFRNPQVRDVELSKIILDSQYGTSNKLSSSGRVPILRMNNIVNGKTTDTDLKFLDSVDKSLVLEKGDILFNRTNSYELVGKTGLFDLDGTYSFASYLVRFRVDMAQTTPEYVVHFLNSDIGRQRMYEYRTKGVSQSNISPSNLLKILIPLPAKKQQIHVMDEVESVNSIITITRQQISRLDSIFRNVVNRMS